ncbi:uncharacterized protein LOC128224658 isoform X2 [Mya arenaria]|uniref:uncharacterized protein LOC128224658 isoform X2 n=1 Tax=Mya arenaria TaxID=6604 RepID=UPI0022E92C43|nr:uncharacterized protein LOC128224658 isoform X2 [Mya arenaria]
MSVNSTQTGCLSARNPQSEAEILRKHVFYQTSHQAAKYPPSMRRSASPVRLPKKTTSKSSANKTNVIKGEVRTSSPVERRQPSPAMIRTRMSLERLDERRLQRKDRERPWVHQKQKSPERKGNFKIFYEKALPTTVENSPCTLRPRKYVSNTKYGNIYEIRDTTKPNKPARVPSPRKWVWEDEFRLWMLESRDQYLSDTGAGRHKLFPIHQQDQLSSKSGSLAAIKEHQKPNPELYA